MTPKESTSRRKPRAIRDDSGYGSIIGCNMFQRKRGKALDMLNK